MMCRMCLGNGIVSLPSIPSIGAWYNVDCDSCQGTGKATQRNHILYLYDRGHDIQYIANLIGFGTSLIKLVINKRG